MFRFTVLLLLAGAGLCFGEDSKPNIDGVYFLPTYKYEPRILTIQGRKFTLEFFGSLPGSVSGLVSSSEKEVGFNYFNGERRVRVQASSAIINGELWLGVFHPVAYSKKQRWVATADELGLLGYAARFCPEGQIMWDWDAETFAHTPLPFVRSKTKTFENVKLLESPTEKINPFLSPVFLLTDFENLLPLFSDYLHQKQIGESDVMTRLGVFAKPGWKLADSFEKLQADNETEAFHKLTQLWPGEVSFQRGYYKRVGDVIIAPWSINLGPIGLLPAKKSAEELAGEWVSDEAKKTVTLEYEPKRDDLFRGLLFGKPDYAKLLGTLQYVEGEGPVHQTGIYQNCMMGRADFAGHIFWFATADGRIVRYIYPSNHGPIGDDPPVNKLHIFRRKK